MSKLYFIPVSIMLALGLASCGESTTLKQEDLADLPVSEQQEITFSSPEPLVSFVTASENGYYKEKEIEDITFSALLKPLDYIKANEELKGHGSTVSDKDDLQYFDFRVTVKDFGLEFLKYKLPDAAEYQNRVAYCSFDMQKDFFLIDGKDTLSCIFYHFERSYDVVPYGHFTLAFEPSKTKAVTAKTLVYYDKLFSKGLIKMTFLPHDLARVPKLKQKIAA